MDARKVSKWQAVVISVLLIILFSSRAIYNMIAVHFRSLVTFGYAKVESSDMVCGMVTALVTFIALSLSLLLFIG